MPEFIFLFIVGTSIGSFLNVLIDRLPKGEQVFTGRSHCDNCGKALWWYDMVPLLSFLILKGRCRYCQKNISWQYPLVELLTGISFVLIYSQLSTFNFHLSTLIYLLIIISGLIVIFFADLKYRIIPDSVLAILIVVSFLFNFFFNQNLLVNHLLSGLLLVLIFLILFLATKGRGMGFGDVKYSFFMGLFSGFPKSMVSFYLAFLTGAIISLILVGGRIKTMKDAVPFGPFLVLATVVSFLWGDLLWTMFLKLAGL